MPIVDESASTGFPRAPGPSPPADSDPDTPASGSRPRSAPEEVVRLGDGHLSGVESLCVGESQ